MIFQNSHQIHIGYNTAEQQYEIGIDLLTEMKVFQTCAY